MSHPNIDALLRLTRVRSEGAILSACKSYRFALWRQWQGGNGFALWIMFNPSTADHINNDPTIRRVVNFSKREGCGALAVVNLHPLRSSQPKDVPKHDEPPRVGLENLKWIAALAHQADFVVCAWGASAKRSPCAPTVTKLLRDCGRDPLCLGTTQDGWPRHPVRLPASTPFVPYQH